MTFPVKIRRVAAKFVPRVLTHEQKEHRVEVCKDLLQRTQDDPLFTSRLITGDETWVYGCHPDAQLQSPQWKLSESPITRKANQVKLVVFFDIRGIVCREFVPEGQAVNADFYCSVLCRLRESIRREKPCLWRDGNWMLQHDNAPAHRALKTREFLSRTGTDVVPHPPYSPDLAPCDFFLFPKIKHKLKGRRFATVTEIRRKSQMVLDSLDETDFHGAFTTLQKRWDLCIAAQGEYFEGEGGYI